jgi:hypothetical protein
MATLKDLSRQLTQLQKQIPFATAQAMTTVVREIAAAQKVALGRKLESPTPFTVNAVGSSGARKNNLRAKVYVRDIAAEYLEPFEFGGEHKLNSQALLNPKNIKLNKYGNMPRNKLSQLKAKPNVFVGEVNGVDAVWQRRKPMKSKRNALSAQQMVRAGRSRNSAPKLLVRFGDALAVTPVLGYMDRSQAMAEALMPGALSRAIADAIRTAR